MNVFRFMSDEKREGSIRSKAPSAIEAPANTTKVPVFTVRDDYKPLVHPPLNDEQQNKLDRLREHTKSFMLPPDHEYYPNEKGFLTEATLKRYMRARKWDYEAAKTMLENTLIWRRDFRPDQLDPDYIRPEAETGKMYFNGFDNTGRPLWIMKPRFQNSKNMERQIKFIVFAIERGIRLMPPQVETLALLVDFKDALYADNPSISTCKKFLDILMNHYPERLGIAYIYNAPWFFVTTFKLIVPFLDPVTRAKAKLVSAPDSTGSTSGDWVNLREHVLPSALEADFGGDLNFEYDVNIFWDALLERTGRPYKIIDYN
ncbi:CRAL-TRIO domain-containing protein [Dichotomocladium elegans]|nr:CRAL-TRIO domain-containing protein [Dichotomocladium elegans]